METKEVVKIIESLASNICICELDLEQNSVYDIDALKIAEMLKHNSSLQK